MTIEGHRHGHLNRKRERGAAPGVFARPVRVSSFGQNLFPRRRLQLVAVAGAVECEEGLVLSHISHRFGTQCRGLCVHPKSGHRHRLCHGRPDEIVSDFGSIQ